MPANRGKLHIAPGQYEDTFYTGTWGFNPSGCAPERYESRQDIEVSANHIEGLMYWLNECAKKGRWSKEYAEHPSGVAAHPDSGFVFNRWNPFPQPFTPIRPSIGTFTLSGVPIPHSSIPNYVGASGLDGYPMDVLGFWRQLRASIQFANERIFMPIQTMAQPSSASPYASLNYTINANTKIQQSGGRWLQTAVLPSNSLGYRTPFASNTPLFSGTPWFYDWYLPMPENFWNSSGYHYKTEHLQHRIDNPAVTGWSFGQWGSHDKLDYMQYFPPNIVALTGHIPMFVHSVFTRAGSSTSGVTHVSSGLMEEGGFWCGPQVVGKSGGMAKFHRGRTQMGWTGRDYDGQSIRNILQQNYHPTERLTTYGTFCYPTFAKTWQYGNVSSSNLDYGHLALDEYIVDDSESVGFSTFFDYAPEILASGHTIESQGTPNRDGYYPVFVHGTPERSKWVWYGGYVQVGFLENYSNFMVSGEAIWLYQSRKTSIDLMSTKSIIDGGYLDKPVEAVVPVGRVGQNAYTENVYYIPRNPPDTGVSEIHVLESRYCVKGVNIENNTSSLVEEGYEAMPKDRRAGAWGYYNSTAIRTQIKRTFFKGRYTNGGRAFVNPIFALYSDDYDVQPYPSAPEFAYRSRLEPGPWGTGDDYLLDDSGGFAGNTERPEDEVHPRYIELIDSIEAYIEERIADKSGVTLDPTGDETQCAQLFGTVHLYSDWDGFSYDKHGVFENPYGIGYMVNEGSTYGYGYRIDTQYLGDFLPDNVGSNKMWPAGSNFDTTPTAQCLLYDNLTRRLAVPTDFIFYTNGKGDVNAAARDSAWSGYHRNNLTVTSDPTTAGLNLAPHQKAEIVTRGYGTYEWSSLGPLNVGSDGMVSYMPHERYTEAGDYLTVPWVFNDLYDHTYTISTAFGTSYTWVGNRSLRSKFGVSDKGQIHGTQNSGVITPTGVDIPWRVLLSSQYMPRNAGGGNYGVTEPGTLSWFEPNTLNCPVKMWNHTEEQKMHNPWNCQFKVDYGFINADTDTYWINNISRRSPATSEVVFNLNTLLIGSSIERAIESGWTHNVLTWDVGDPNYVRYVGGMENPFLVPGKAQEQIVSISGMLDAVPPYPSSVFFMVQYLSPKPSWLPTTSGVKLPEDPTQDMSPWSHVGTDDSKWQVSSYHKKYVTAGMHPHYMYSTISGYDRFFRILTNPIEIIHATGAPALLNSQSIGGVYVQLSSVPLTARASIWNGSYLSTNFPDSGYLRKDYRLQDNQQVNNLPYPGPSGANVGVTGDSFKTYFCGTENGTTEPNAVLGGLNPVFRLRPL